MTIEKSSDSKGYTVDLSSPLKELCSELISVYWLGNEVV